LRRAVIGSGFPVSGFGPKSSVYPTICQIFVPSPDSRYIVSMSLYLLVNSTGYCVDHYLYLITLLEWELRAPSRTRLLGGQFRRSRGKVFIVQDGGFDPKNELRQNLSKKLLPEVEIVASGRGFLAVLDVVLYHRPEAPLVGCLGQIAGQVGGVLEA
jgi:hypothetical protein